MTYQEVTSVSWFGRIKNSVVGVLVGIVLILAMIILLFWNEGRAVTTARSLEEGAGIVVSVSADQIDPANEDALVHVTGMVTTNDMPSDPDFGIMVNALQLLRQVEMYQWVEESRSETTKNLGGSEDTVTTYTYSRRWSEQEHESSEFRHPDGRENPPMELRRGYFPVEDASIGEFQLSSTVIAMIDNQEPLRLGRENAEAIQDVVGRSHRVHIIDGNIYLGDDPHNPQVGDYRISYKIVPIGPASVIGQQAGDGIVNYQTNAGDRLLLVTHGIASASDMFADAAQSNAMLTWILRAVAVFMLVIGFAMIMGPLGVIADIVPILGSIVRFGSGIVAIIFGIMTGTLTIAVAWFWYRPLTSLIVIAVGFGISWLLTQRAKKNASQASASIA